MGSVKQEPVVVVGGGGRPTSGASIHVGLTIRTLLALFALCWFVGVGVGLAIGWWAWHGSGGADTSSPPATTAIPTSTSGTGGGACGESAGRCAAVAVAASEAIPAEVVAVAPVNNENIPFEWNCAGQLTTPESTELVTLQTQTVDWLVTTYRLTSPEEARTTVDALRSAAASCTDDSYTYTVHPDPTVGDNALLVSLVDHTDVTEECFPTTERDLQSRCRRDALFVAVDQHLLQLFVDREWREADEAAVLAAVTRAGEAASAALR